MIPFFPPFGTGEMFPYTNSQNLNMDWIISIVRQLIDNYNTIEQTVDSGKLELIATKDELEGLLNQWYNTHSDTIATQLNNAVITINNLVSESIESIPSDYTDFFNAFKRQVNDNYLESVIGCAPYTDTLPTTSNGITFTKTSDGGIKAEGTATGTAVFMIRNPFTIPSSVKRVSITGCPAGGSDTTYRLGLAYRTSGSEYTHLCADTGNGTEYAITDHTKDYILLIRINAGTTINNTFYPVIRDCENISNKKLGANALYGQNIVSLPYYDGTFTNRSGVSAVSNWNGEVVLTSQGTNDSNVNFYVLTDITFPKTIRRVKISGCPTNPSTPKFCIRLGLYTPTGSGTSGWNTVATDYGNGAEVDVLPNGKYLLVITTLPTMAFNGIVFKPAITDADSVSIKDTQETVYGNAKMLFLKTSGTFQGDCCIVNTGYVNGLIDMGYDPECTTLKAQLINNRITSLDFVVLTHYHSDHATNDFVTAMDRLQDAGINFSNCIFYLPHKDIDWTQWIGTEDNKEQYEAEIKSCLDTLGIKYVYPSDNEVFPYNKNFSMRFFNTQNFTDYYDYCLDMNENPIDHTNYNSFSMVTELSIYGKKVIMSSDITPIAQEKCYGNIRGCDLYKVEHHGINSGASNGWLNAINPQFAIVPNYNASYTNYYTFTRKTVRTLAMKSSVYTTLSGMVTAIINASAISVYGGMTNEVGYGSIPTMIMKQLAGVYMVNAFESEALPITSEGNPYLNITGKYIVKNNTVYFSLYYEVLANINSGAGNVTSSLPVPVHDNDLFWDMSGSKYVASMTYNNGWRVNGRHNQGDYGFIAGSYEIEVTP